MGETFYNVEGIVGDVVCGVDACQVAGVALKVSVGPIETATGRKTRIRRL